MFIGDGFFVRGLCSFLTWEGGKEIRTKKKYQKGIWTWGKLRGKKISIVCFVCESIENNVSYR